MYVLDRFYVIDGIFVWNYRATNESFEYAAHTKEDLICSVIISSH